MNRPAENVGAIPGSIPASPRDTNRVAAPVGVTGPPRQSGRGRRDDGCNPPEAPCLATEGHGASGKAGAAGLTRPGDHLTHPCRKIDVTIGSRVDRCKSTIRLFSSTTVKSRQWTY